MLVYHVTEMLTCSSAKRLCLGDGSFLFLLMITNKGKLQQVVTLGNYTSRDKDIAFFYCLFS